MANETRNQKWVRQTRESVARAMSAEGIPVSAQYLEDNLDIGDWFPSLGRTGYRSAREIGAAMKWLVEQGYAERLPANARSQFDPPGVLFEINERGVKYAATTEKGK